MASQGIVKNCKGEGTPRKLATAISEKNRRFQAENWFPDQQAHTEETYVWVVAHIVLSVYVVRRNA
jgi:hypothetical protein